MRGKIEITRIVKTDWQPVFPVYLFVTLCMYNECYTCMYVACIHDVRRSAAIRLPIIITVIIRSDQYMYILTRTLSEGWYTLYV